jgi:hypothetical protein
MDRAEPPRGGPAARRDRARRRHAKRGRRSHLAGSPAGREYEAAGDGAAWSVDGGETWTPADAGRNRGYVWALSVDPLDPDTWYVSAAPGPYQAHGDRLADAFVYRWRGSGPWEPLEGALAGPLDVMPYALAASADELVVGMRDGRVFVGEDYGDGWRPAGDGPLVERIVAWCLLP